MIGAAALAAFALASSPADTAAQAAPATASVVVIGYDSESSDAAELVAKALPTGWVRADNDAYRATLKAEKATSAPNKAFATIASRQAFAGRVRRAGLTAKVDAVVMVRSVPQQGGSKIDVIVVSADKETPALDATYLVASDSPELGGASSAVATSLRGLPINATLAVPSASAAPPPPPPPPPAPDEVKPEADEGPRPPYIELAIGAGVASRSLSYNDALTTSLSSYSGTAPEGAVELEARPFAGKGPALRGLSLQGELHSVFLLKSTDPVTGDKLDTSWLRAAGSLRWRYEVAPRTFVGLSAGVLHDSFKVKGANLAPPNTGNTFVRLGLNARVAAGPVAILAQGAYLLSLSGGEVADRLRDASVGGVEGGLGVAVPLGKRLEVRAQGLYTRVFYAFKPQPGDPFVAGGALDQQVRGQAQLVLMF
jgi:hypothetical protein